MQLVATRPKAIGKARPHASALGTKRFHKTPRGIVGQDRGLAQAMAELDSVGSFLLTAWMSESMPDLDVCCLVADEAFI